MVENYIKSSTSTTTSSIPVITCISPVVTCSTTSPDQLGNTSESQVETQLRVSSKYFHYFLIPSLQRLTWCETWARVSYMEWPEMVGGSTSHVWGKGHCSQFSRWARFFHSQTQQVAQIWRRILLRWPTNQNDHKKNYMCHADNTGKKHWPQILRCWLVDIRARRFKVPLKDTCI